MAKIKNIEKDETMIEVTKTYERPDLYKLNKQAMDSKMRYRYIEEPNIERRLAEGWVMVSGEEGKRLRPHRVDPNGLQSTGGTNVRVGKCYLMKIPKTEAHARDEYFRSINQKKNTAMRNDMQEEAEKSGMEVLSGDKAMEFDK